MQTDVMALAQEIDGHLRFIQQTLRQPMQTEIAKTGFTGPQLKVLRALFRSPGMSLKELCEEVGLAHSTVSGIVDRLETRGILKRQTDAADRRLSRIFLSKRVRDYIQNALPGIRLHPLLLALEGMKPSARDTTLRGLRFLRQAIERS
jgi:DNA-binding MarR family transcriptional regulator